MAEAPLDDARSQTLRLLAHDLNNPLTAIRILAEMLREEIQDEALRRDMSDVLEAADLATILVDGLSSVVRTGTEDDEFTWFPLDLAEVVRHVVDRPALRAHVQVCLPPEVLIAGDRRALQRAFTDLLLNARRLVEGSGKIEVTLREKGANREVVVHHPAPAVPAAMREGLFHTWGAVELRREHRIPVSALGLSYVRHVFRRHGGDVVTEDGAGGGMNVVITLPR